jgi:hypothetical protein
VGKGGAEAATPGFCVAVVGEDVGADDAVLVDPLVEAWVDAPLPCAG